MKLDFLANHPGAIATIAKWYVDEWGHLPQVNTMKQAEENLRVYLNRENPFDDCSQGRGGNPGHGTA